MFRGLLVLISFFTRIPIGKWVKYDENAFKKGLCLYCLLGLVIGGFLALGYCLGEFLQIIMIKGLIITVFYIIITGGIHLDGTSDTVDGLFSGRTGDKIFEIMSDSRVGSFGVLSLIFVFSSQLIMFSYIDLATLALVPIVGRASVVVSCLNMNYAKSNAGMGTIFIDNIGGKEVCTNVILVLVLAIIFYITNTPAIIAIKLIPIVLTFLTVLLIARWIKGKINGMTGDTCGFVAEISQIIFMLFSLIIEKVLIL